MPIFILPFLFFLSCPLFAQFGANHPIHQQVAMEVTQTALQDKGHLAVLVTLPEGWHIYADPAGPGPGLPTVVTVDSAPEGLKVGKALFLPGKKYVPKGEPEDGYNWIYEKKAAFFLPVEAAAGLKGKTLPLKISIDYLICSEATCVPGKRQVDYTLHRDGKPGSRAEIFKDLSNAREGLGRIEPENPKPETSSTSLTSSSLSIEKIDAFLQSLRPVPIDPTREVKTLWKALLFALIAGLILNVMPCVLPVISIKILGFVKQAGASRERIFRLGLSFAAGIMTVFIFLAFLTVMAKIGWGGLFQREEFLLGMMSVIFLFALSLFGIFILDVPGAAAAAASRTVGKGYGEAFFKGVMATLLATPCSGPFLGGAMAWTLLQPAWIIVLVFFCLGLGMAFPYVILTANPALLKWVPKPGNWMIHFERVMGFVLLGTVVYLFMIVPPASKNAAAGFLLSLALGAYVWGQMTTLSDSTARRLTIRALALGLALGGGFFCKAFLFYPDLKYEVKYRESSEWMPFSYGRLFVAAEAGRPVIVDFTADWCPNCKWVEASVLHSSQIQAAVKEMNAELLTVDITRPDPDKQKLLEKLGSQSIPFLAVFQPGNQLARPGYLRDVYSIDQVLRGLRGDF